jgi:hypothetical protein
MNQLYLIHLDKLKEIYNTEIDIKYKQKLFDIIKERENLYANGFSE